MSTGAVHVARLSRMRLCSAQAEALAAFYEAALGFRRVDIEKLAGAQSESLFGIGGRVLRITLALGAERVELVQFLDQPGRAYPVGTDASDRLFQHFAIVVDDMVQAMAQLARTPGWSAISRGGAQQLPPTSGGVSAFKFRDPEGHPLELLAFAHGAVPACWQHVSARGLFLGIDHSAISVANSARSIAFYAGLGLVVSNRSLNEDPAQARLDGLDHPVAEVIALAPEHAPPHLELLCYRDVERRAALELHANDVAATCLIFETQAGSPQLDASAAPLRRLIDPDGHHLAIVRSDS